MDELVVATTPESMRSVGSWYEDFHQLTDAEVIRCLDRVWEPNDDDVS